jgi:hypothetical protein
MWGTLAVGWGRRAEGGGGDLDGLEEESGALEIDVIAGEAGGDAGDGVGNPHGHAVRRASNMGHPDAGQWGGQTRRWVSSRQLKAIWGMRK